MSVYGSFGTVFGKRQNFNIIRGDAVKRSFAEYRGKRTSQLGINARSKIDYILYAVVFKNFDTSYSQLIGRKSYIVTERYHARLFIFLGCSITDDSRAVRISTDRGEICRICIRNKHRGRCAHQHCEIHIRHTLKKRCLPYGKREYKYNKRNSGGCGKKYADYLLFLWIFFFSREEIVYEFCFARLIYFRIVLDMSCKAGALFHAVLSRGSCEDKLSLL